MPLYVRAGRHCPAEYAFFFKRSGVPGRMPNTGALLSSMLEARSVRTSQPGESGWPYLSATPADAASWAPPRDIGKLYGRNGATATHSIDHLIQELDHGRPVHSSWTILSRAFYQRSPQGVVDPAPGEQPEPDRRHAVIAVGHGKVDGQRALLVRNSWGPSWGDAGYGWLTERFLGPRIYAAATLLEEVDVPADPIAA